jgi:hypothetical protein
MNTPPDGPGGERSPIASTVPDPNESLSAQNPAIEMGASPTEASGDARKKRLQGKRPIGRVVPPMMLSAKPNASEPGNGVANTLTSQSPKGQGSLCQLSSVVRHDR